MISLLTIAVMLVVAYAMIREGLFASFCNLVNVVISGTMAFHFWPPIANELESSLQGSFADKFEDAIALVLVYLLVAGVLRVITNILANRDLELPGKVSQGVGAGVGLVTGYLVSGFLVCVMQTIPWHENFLSYPQTSPGLSSRFLPADQVWLKLMRRAFTTSLDNIDAPDQTAVFDDFASNFAKYRRYNDSRDALIYVPPQPPPDPNMIDDPNNPGGIAAPTDGNPTPPRKQPEKKNPPKMPDPMDTGEKKDPTEPPQQ